MALTFADVMKKREATFAKTVEQAKKLNSGQEKDPRFWEPTKDASGVGYAKFRFLPPAGEEEMAWVSYWYHNFQGPGGVYNELCLTTLGPGTKDPVVQHTKELWDAGDKKTVSERKRKLVYISNIYMIDDPANPENNGKVFLYRYGQQVFQKLNEKLVPPHPKMPKLFFYDFELGADFNLTISVKKTGENEYPNYESSFFDAPSNFLDGDVKEWEKVWKQEHSLAAFISPDKFKSYEELEQKLEKVLSKSGRGSSIRKPTSVIEDTIDDEIPEAKWKAEKKDSPSLKTAAPASNALNDEDDDTASFFASLKDD